MKGSCVRVTLPAPNKRTSPLDWFFYLGCSLGRESPINLNRISVPLTWSTQFRVLYFFTQMRESGPCPANHGQIAGWRKMPPGSSGYTRDKRSAEVGKYAAQREEPPVAGKLALTSRNGRLPHSGNLPVRQACINAGTAC